ncbi:MAG: response regulator, partial [Solirubrobacterales bacterium]|nr:response regulator [Solirubrobacterales bacterium]
EALRLLPSRGFDLILTDINMPDINGLELINFVKSNPTYREIPLIIVTTERSEEYRRRGGDPAGIAVHEPQQQGAKPLPQLVVDLADHAEVDQPDDAARLDEEVAGMRIGVEEPILEHHLGDDPRRTLGQRMAVDPGSVQRVQVGDVEPPDPLERQHPRRRGVPVNARDVHVGIAREVRSEALGVAPFAEVVDLRPEGVRELLGDTDDVVARRSAPPPVRASREVEQDLEVAVDLLHDARPPDLDDDLGPVLQHRRMGLADRCGRQRLGVEGGEDLGGRATELASDDGLDVLPRYGGRRVLQPRQLRLVLRRQQVGPCGEDLAELDERRTQLLEREPHVLGLPVRLVAARVPEQAAVERHEAVQARHPDKPPEPVPGEGLGDLAVAVEVPAAHVRTNVKLVGSLRWTAR